MRQLGDAVAKYRVANCLVNLIILLNGVFQGIEIGNIDFLKRLP